jgi:DNA-binding beta-propeller fold protein YncE
MRGKAGMLAANRLKGWSLSAGAFRKNPATVVGQLTLASSGSTSFDFSPDGSRMYVVDNNDDSIDQYSLSVGWDPYSASYQQSKSIATGGTLIPFGIAFKSDGAKFFLVENYAKEIKEYSLSAAWDISTAGLVQSKSISVDVGTPGGLFVSADGLHMHVVELSTSEVHQYALSSAWDVSTASHVRTSGSLSPFGATPRGVTFKPAGTKMFITQDNANYIAEYDLSAAFDVSTITSAGSLSVGFQTGNPEDVTFSPDGVNMFVLSPQYLWAYTTP